MYYEVVVLGVIISIIFSEITGLSPAGLIVPGYIALCLRTPNRIVYTLLVALAAFLLIRLLSNYIILYGRRRFAVVIFLTFAIDALIFGTYLLAAPHSIIGVLVPGITANEFDKQGVARSLLSLGCVVGVIVLIMFAMNVPLL